MNRLRGCFGLLLKIALLILLLLLPVGGAAWWFFHPAHTESEQIVYTQRHGHDLTLRVIRPEMAKGIGVLMIVSGAWKSGPQKFESWMAASFLRQGMTVIAVSHLSQPEATIQEIVQDVQRSVRFVRLHAQDYGIDPKRLGVVGGSSGGHLSLMLATRGGAGEPGAADAVLREDGSVQAAAVFYPVTDLINLGSSTENLHDGGPPKSFRKSFGPEAADLAQWKVIGQELSPIFHISSALPPIYIIHGSADTLVPLEQSERFQKRAAELGHHVILDVRSGKKHGWPTMMWDAHLMAQWMVQQLQASPAPAAP
ncbi:Acetyl esterase/lipase [Prosthecobacter debontii]|uniref:Acetyl esterase/lipase n=1 Tax=Prosthecobacter debontii TaxID=48467 RepID=A0A1T4XM42_9BACT|nr:alpha/beta hydrolase [Prosthecobacter debontii]SKA90228.1 Acetyl esterase/lipase [Prosthecobacter debontii]